MYSQKTIQNLKPSWYLALSQKEKLAEQAQLKKERDEMWLNKPKPIHSGTIILAKETVKNITKDKQYKVQGYFATLVTTLYYSEWHEFVTIKNDNGYTVKMNLRKFIINS